MNYWPTQSDAVREQLESVLMESLRLNEQLIELLRTNADPAQLVDRIMVIERLDSVRDRLVRQLRASSRPLRPQDEQPVRITVFEALEELGNLPQPTSLLHDFIFARFTRDVPSRVFAVLRRDEHNSWDRKPGNRVGYIAPALD